MPLSPGQILNNRYRIVKLLGQGGFGAVYRAWDLNLNGPCAVKENFDTSPEAQSQFAREASILYNLRHPNLPRVFDHFTVPGQGQYLVMDFIEGEDLEEKLKGGPLSETQVLPWIGQICDALTYLHSQTPPVLHRDIKPANILITPDGKAMLVDFGISKVYDPNLRTTMGARAVTPGYSAPEQYGRGATDSRTDIYALGATLYKLITEHEPLESPRRMLGEHMSPAHQVNPAVPSSVSQAIERAMSLKPGVRFQDVDAFRQALLVRQAGAPASVIVSRVEAPAQEQAMVSPSMSQQTQKDTDSMVVDRFTKLVFPNRCVLHEKIPLRIQLTCQVPILSRALQRLSLKFKPGQQAITLNVMVTAPGFKLDRHHQPLKVPLKNDSPEITFWVTPFQPGAQVVEVEFYQQKRRVGHLLVATRVYRMSQARETQIKPAELRLLQDPRENLVTETMETLEEGCLLSIAWHMREERLVYCLPERKPDLEWHQEAAGLQKYIESALHDLNTFLLEVVTANTADDEAWESLCLNMQAYGAALYRTLIPGPLAIELQGLPDSITLVISTDEQWIPWELLHDGKGFWGSRFILARVPRPNDYSCLPEARRVVRPSSKKGKALGKVVNVIGGGLPLEVSHRAAHLFDTLSPTKQVRTLNARPVSELAKALPASLLHCTCHGHIEPHQLQVAADTSRLNNLPPETVNLLRLEPGGLVFANACASAAPGLFFGRFNSFGWQFYLRGTGAFVGTLGPVPAQQAIEFAEVLYTALFQSHPPLTLGQAMAQARATMEQQRNLFWLLYCLYGDPDYQVGAR